MIDLETLATRVDAAIIQIGVAAFNDKEVVKSHLWYVEPAGYVDPMTVSWWFDQISKGVLNPMRSDRAVPLTDALKDLRSRMKEVDTVWAHRSSFDIPILTLAYERSGVPLPWSHKMVRDTVTIANFFPEIERPTPELHHDAESDARAQAEWMINLFKANELKNAKLEG
jgi:exodeoxyribonuclease VIII